jgi:plastocyanin
MRKHEVYCTARIQLLWIALLGATTATLLLVACGGTSTGTAQSSTTATVQPSPARTSAPVTIAHVQIVEKNGQYAFDPAKLTVKVGTQIIWTNTSDAPHTVTSDSLAFNTPNNLDQHQTFALLFTKPGTYPYYCNIHTYMLGTITVTP